MGVRMIFIIIRQEITANLHSELHLYYFLFVLKLTLLSIVINRPGSDKKEDP